MTNEFQLVEKRELREEFIGRMEVLDKVGDLILLPSTEFATTEQVATYYGVGKDVIRQILTRNSDEFKEDGLKVMSGKLIKQEFENRDSMSQVSIINSIGGFLIDGTQYKVFGLNECTKGIRWDCAYIDTSLNLDLLNTIVFPMAKYTTEIHWF